MGPILSGMAPDLEVIGLVRDALANDRLRVDAQPIVGLASGGMVAEELLVRIVAENGEVVAPHAFVPVAEQYGLMPIVDRIVVDRAAALAATGRAVQLNVSATTLESAGFVDDVLASVHRHGAAPSRMTFEITESSVPADMAQVAGAAKLLAKRGFGIALDDFGSGWGALQYLKEVPVNMIKIDREFVHDLCSNSEAVRLLRAIVALARVLGHQTVAEGVEDERVSERLVSLGCDYIQGFALAHPMPADAMLRWLRAHVPVD